MRSLGTNRPINFVWSDFSASMILPSTRFSRPYPIARQLITNSSIVQFSLPLRLTIAAATSPSFPNLSASSATYNADDWFVMKLDKSVLLYLIVVVLNWFVLFISSDNRPRSFSVLPSRRQRVSPAIASFPDSRGLPLRSFGVRFVLDTSEFEHEILQFPEYWEIETAFLTLPRSSRPRNQDLRHPGKPERPDRFQPDCRQSG